MEFDLQRFYNINRRAVMWVAFFAILYLMRDFFAVMFLTFIFGFVMRSAAVFITRKTRGPYWAAVVFPYLAVLTGLVLLTVTAVPRVMNEAAVFSRRVPNLLDTLAREIKTAAARYDMEPMLARYVNLPATESSPAAGSQPDGSLAPAPLAGTVDSEALVRELRETGLHMLPGSTAKDERQVVAELLGHFAQGLIDGTLQFLLAVLLSFLIVLDFEGIATELRNWRRNPVGRFFQEAASSLVDFSDAVGRAFQCQLIVALLNAAITCAGLFVLGIGPLLLLTTIVFIFGLIPVLGVFISSVPIILIAVNDYGLSRALMALGLIVVVHLLEAYVFNPRIYAARFHLNPVIVLIILLIAHKLFGVWGMLLGIPVTHYVLNLAQMPAQTRKGHRRRPKDQESTGIAAA